MKRLLYIPVLVCTLLVLGSFKGPLIDMDKIKLAVNAPEKAKVDGEFTVEMIVNKEGETGFCKLEHVLPEGFIATEVDAQGAVFIFTKQTVKFIWLQIPANNQIKVKYKVKVDPSVLPEKYTLEGRFSYTENKKIKRAEAPRWNITVEK